MHAILLAILLAPYPQKAAILALDEGMSMKEVRRMMGDPDKSESRTCGSKTKSPWDCRIWTYEGYDDSGTHHTLRVTFQRLDGGTWIVNGWSE